MGLPEPRVGRSTPLKPLPGEETTGFRASEMCCNEIASEAAPPQSHASHRAGDPGAGRTGMRGGLGPDTASDDIPAQVPGKSSTSARTVAFFSRRWPSGTAQNFAKRTAYTLALASQVIKRKKCDERANRHRGNRFTKMDSSPVDRRVL
jgi:hypothetical protein